MCLQGDPDQSCLMRRGDFIARLCAVFHEEADGVYLRGRRNGWLEQEDELFAGDPVSRKNVARILHMYLMKEKGVKDLPDINDAKVLRDLYDCRVCANHVAQMYLRGIMDARTMDKNGEYLWFDLEAFDQNGDIEESINRAKEFCS